MSHSLGKPKDGIIRKNKVCLRIMRVQSYEACHTVFNNPPFTDRIILTLNKTQKDCDGLIITFHLLSALSYMQIKEKDNVQDQNISLL